MNGSNLDNSIVPHRGSARRLLVALALSCLLHAFAVLGPFQGRPQADDRPRSSWLASRTATLTAAFLPASGPQTDTPASDPGRAESDEHSSPDVATYGADILPLSGVPYFPAERLTRRPQPMAAIDLDAPDIHGIPASGRLILSVWIDATGRVIRVETGRSDLPEKFAASAAAAFGRSRFIPGEIDGLPVASVLRLEVTYDDPRAPLNPSADLPQTPSAAGN